MSERKGKRQLSIFCKAAGIISPFAIQKMVVK